MTDVRPQLAPRRSIAERSKRALLGAALGLVGVVAIFEAACRLAPLPGLSRAELDPTKSQLENSRVVPHPYLAYAGRPDFRVEPTEKSPLLVSHNSLGLNGPEATWEKPEGVYRIVCLGGSSTYGIGPSSTFTNWPVILQQELNLRGLAKPVEVLNLGLQGYSTFESQINLALRGVEFRPDLVLVYHTINDMRCALYPGVVRDNTHWRAIWPVERPDKLRDALELSYTFLAVRRYATDWIERQRDLGSYVIVDFGKYAPDDYAQPTDPELGFSNFRRNLVSIVGVARAHGAEVLLATQATRMGDFERFGSSELQKQAFERMTKLIGEVANERSVPYCDVRTAVEGEADRQRAEAGADRVFVRPDKRNGEVHLTDEGCALVARTLAERIVELGLVK
jgi:lysophospholipase L1-like esterase